MLFSVWGDGKCKKWGDGKSLRKENFWTYLETWKEIRY